MRSSIGTKKNALAQLSCKIEIQPFKLGQFLTQSFGLSPEPCFVPFLYRNAMTYLQALPIARIFITELLLTVAGALFFPLVARGSGKRKTILMSRVRISASLSHLYSINYSSAIVLERQNSTALAENFIGLLLVPLAQVENLRCIGRLGLMGSLELSVLVFHQLQDEGGEPTKKIS